MKKAEDIPRNYYNSRFQAHLSEFMGKIYVGAFPRGGKHFHLAEIRSEQLNHIPKDELPLFLSALACNTFFDQFMYSHFRRLYRKNLSDYPKITSSYSNCTNIIPWELLNVSGVSRIDREREFKRYIEFYIPRMKKTLEDNYPSISWEKFIEIARNDTDVTKTVFGDLFVKALYEKTN